MIIDLKLNRQLNFCDDMADNVKNAFLNFSTTSLLSFNAAPFYQNAIFNYYYVGILPDFITFQSLLIAFLGSYTSIMEIPNQPIVIDNGSGSIKAGFAGEDKPRVIFPNYVGQPKYQRVLPGALLKESFVGKQLVFK